MSANSVSATCAPWRQCSPGRSSRAARSSTAFTNLWPSVAPKRLASDTASLTNGIAHFAEHMFFKGTERRPTAKDISAEVDGIGGEFNAFTSKEYTGYYIKCAAEHRSLALDVLADQILHSKFDAEELERAKGGSSRS